MSAIRVAHMHALHQPKTHRLWLAFLGCRGRGAGAKRLRSSHVCRKHPSRSLPQSAAPTAPSSEGALEIRRPKTQHIPGRTASPGDALFFSRIYLDHPARISNFSTPSAEPTRAIMASRSSLISLVSALMVTPAQPLVGMVWLMVRIFAPELAKIDR